MNSGSSLLSIELDLSIEQILKLELRKFIYFVNTYLIKKSSFKFVTYKEIYSINMCLTINHSINKSIIKI